jgi:uncharacterized protein
VPVNEATIVGVIADTHGLLRPEAVRALAGSDHIIHAGDVDRPEILDELRAVAPLTVVRGNVDHGRWAQGIPLTQVVPIGDHLIYVLHDRDALSINPAAAGFAAVIYGHSHRPLIETRHGVLYMNPGSAGPRRFTLPISLGRLHVTPAGIRGELITLSPS